MKPDQTVELRPVTVARIAGAETVIKEGLKPGETVVTDGQLRLVPGSRISVKGAERREGGVMNLAALFIKRPITTTLIMLGIIVFGVMSYQLLPVSDLPTVDFPTIQVQRRPAGRQPRDDGVGRGAAAREAVLDDRRPRRRSTRPARRATPTSRCSST